MQKSTKIHSSLTPFLTPVPFTRTFLPPLEQFVPYLQEIWERQWVTNKGPALDTFEKQLTDVYQTENLSVFTNGTLALQTGIQGLGLQGEVITTPFTFVATLHALRWNGCTPVFADIDEDSYNIDPEQVESLITPQTTAILGVHVFGVPCNHARLSRIAGKHGLKLVYDAAHAFGVRVDGKPVTSLGDLSMVSFHGSKTFHTFEGGICVFRDPSLKEKLDAMKNIGIRSETEIPYLGTNAKMTEIQAAMGSLMLQYTDYIFRRKREIFLLYRERLQNIPGLIFRPLPDEYEWNYAYVPVRVDKTEFPLSRDELYRKLKEYNVFSRRYFYPLLTDVPCYSAFPARHPIPVSRRIAEEILVLPSYPDLGDHEVEKICDIISMIFTTEGKEVQNA